MYTYSYVFVHVYACVISYFRVQITFWFEAVAQMENSSLQCNYCKVLIQDVCKLFVSTYFHAPKNFSLYINGYNPVQCFPPCGQDSRLFPIQYMIAPFVA